MKYFDLHCDTATHIFNFQTDLTDSRLHINYKSIAVFNEYYQLCAIFTDDSKPNDMQYFENAVAYFSEKIKKVKNFHPLYSIEGGAILQGNIDNIDILKAYNVKAFAFSWNGENELAAGNLFDPKRPLSPLGIQALRKLNEYNIVPDISHLSDGGVYDIMNQSEKPFIATHSNARCVCGHMRNCTDEQIAEIFRRDGIIGLNLYPPTVSENGYSADSLLKHIDHMLSLGGENHICVGADWDGMIPSPDIKDASAIPGIYDRIANVFSKKVAEKIVFSNAYNFFFKNKI